MLSKFSLSSQDTDKKVRCTLFCSYQYLISKCFLISHFSHLGICSTERASHLFGPNPALLIQLPEVLARLAS